MRVKPSTVGNTIAAPSSGDPEAAAADVATMSAELAAIARRHRLDTLACLLDMVRLEAEARQCGERKDVAPSLPHQAAAVS